MNENLKTFLEEASKNEELKAKLAALTDKNTAVAKTVELAKEYGFALTAEDFQPADGAELSLDELDSVAGGWCLFAGGGSSGTKKITYCEKCGEPKEDETVGQPCSKCGTILKEIVLHYN